MLGDQAPGRARVHKPLQVHEHGRAAHVRRYRGIEFVEFFRLLHASSLPPRTTVFAVQRTVGPDPSRDKSVTARPYLPEEITLSCRGWKRSTARSCRCCPVTGA